MSGRGTIRIVAVPMDLGGNRRGVDMGPSALRIAGLRERLQRLGYTVEDSGNVPVPIAEQIPAEHDKDRFLEEITQVCTGLSDRVRQALADGCVPLVLGGDHSLSAGSVAGTAAHFRGLNQKVGLIWVDAHTDMNTPETSPSGNVHGMPLAALMGLEPAALSGIEGFAPKVDPSNAVVVGARSIDRSERANIEACGLRVITMTELDKRGLGPVMKEALEIATRDTAGFACSFDLDVIDPQTAPGVGTPVRGGITYRESHLVMEMVADSGALLSLEVVELNPVLDRSNVTGQLGAELIASALGKKIL